MSLACPLHLAGEVLLCAVDTDGTQNIHLVFLAETDHFLDLFHF